MADRQEAFADFYDGRQDLVDAGLRPYRVFVVVRSWSGGMPGLGMAVERETEILPRPDVDDAGMSAGRWGGLYGPGDMVVSKITPKHEDPDAPGSYRGMSPTDLVPAVDRAEDEVLYRIVHDDVPDEPTHYSIVSSDFSQPFQYRLVLRRRTERQGGFSVVRTPQYQP